jgi:hypothetical protein
MFYLDLFGNSSNSLFINGENGVGSCFQLLCPVGTCWGR